MIQILSNSNETSFNLALEEYLLKESNEEYLLIYINKPSVIVGRNQNPFIEVNSSFLNENNIELHRRISGGGTVYHDLGNINYSFIVNNLDNLNNYEYFIDKIIHKLSNANVPLKFVEPTHIYLDNGKVSGNAQTFHKNRVLHHGTLLFDTDLDNLNNCIKESSSVHSKSIKSRVAEVTNIKEYIGFNALLHLLIPDYRGLTADEIDGALSYEKKYHTWDWKYAESPKYELIIDELILSIRNGIIEKVNDDIPEITGLPLKLETLNSLDFKHKDRIISKIKTLY